MEAAGRAGGLTGIVLRGPSGSGKTRLLEELSFAVPIHFEVIAAHEADAMDLFGEINRTAAAGQVLLIETRSASAKLFGEGEAPPDLLSRLGALPEVVLDRPGEEALLEALRADLLLHHQTLKPREIAQTAARLPREFGAVRRFCRALDRVPGGRNSAERLNWAMERAQQTGGDSP
jgi:hypothetical protein